MTGGVFRCQGVEYKLEVWLAVSCILVQLSKGSEKLCRRDGNLSIGQGQQVNTCRYAFRVEHVVALLVSDVNVV